MKQRVLLIDGDILCYRSSAVTEVRSVLCRHIPSGTEKILPTKTDLLEYLKVTSYEYEEADWQIIQRQDARSLKTTLEILESTLSKIKTIAFPDVVEVYISSGQNFRHTLDLPTPYKDHRGDLKPVNLLACRKYAVDKFKFIDCSDMMLETDDVLSIRAYEELEQGNVPCIASIDKDTRQANGVYMLDWTKDVPREEYLPFIGSLWKENNTIKGTGLKFLAYQILAGDATDTYKPYALANDVFGIKYGPGKAAKALELCSTTRELKDVILSEYARFYPTDFEYTNHLGFKVLGNAEKMLSTYFKCAYMKRSWTDDSNFHDFFDNVEDYSKRLI